MGEMLEVFLLFCQERAGVMAGRFLEVTSTRSSLPAVGLLNWQRVV